MVMKRDARPFGDLPKSRVILVDEISEYFFLYTEWDDSVHDILRAVVVDLLDLLKLIEEPHTTSSLNTGPKLNGSFVSSLAWMIYDGLPFLAELLGKFSRVFPTKGLFVTVA